MACSVLIIEDEAVLARNMQQYLQRRGHEVQVAHSAEQGLPLLQAQQPDVLVLDFNLPGHDGMHVLKQVSQLSPATQTIMVTGHGHVELAVEAMKAGAADFLTKPVPLNKLQLLVERAAQQVRRDRALAYHQQRQGDGAQLAAILGDSEPMRRLRERLQQVLAAETRLQHGPPPAVLVRGETGTGKELVAKALHFEGSRRANPFVELNCAALPEALLESELFGHERGAFTDARERKLGLAETADGGTLFLDEIGDLPLGSQAKLLKLLEERSLRRVGGLTERQVDVRIIAATHRPLDELVALGRFRADLYYRLRVVQLDVPALSERGADVLLLAQAFVAAHARRYGKPAPLLEPSAQQALMAHAWPGNVRELRNLLEQAVLLDNSGRIDAALLNLPIAATAPGLRASGTTLAKQEHDLLLSALVRTHWNVSQAARELGVSRDTLRYRMDKHGLSPPPPLR